MRFNCDFLAYEGIEWWNGRVPVYVRGASFDGARNALVGTVVVRNLDFSKQVYYYYT